AIYVHKLADLPLIEALLATGVPAVRMVHDHDLYCMRSYKYHYFSRHICTRPASPYCIFPCGAFMGRNHDGGFPIKWVSYSAKKKEIELNRRFDRLVVATQYMQQELLRNGFAADKIEIHPPVPCLGDRPASKPFAATGQVAADVRRRNLSLEGRSVPTRVGDCSSETVVMTGPERLPPFGQNR